MKKNMYKQPQTEVLTIHSEYMMLDPISPKKPDDSSTPPGVHAPKRGEAIP